MYKITFDLTHAIHPAVTIVAGDKIVWSSRSLASN
jgi:hypothetical protein